MNIKTILLESKALLPSKATKFSAGYDLFSIENSCILKPGERKLFRTGLVLEIPEGFYGRIAPRSGLSLKKGIDTMAGVIDSDYRGEIGVILINLSNEDQLIDTTKPIAQIIIEKCYDVIFEKTDIISNTTRGSNGFGSSDAAI